MIRYRRLLCAAAVVFAMTAPMFEAFAEMGKTRRFHGSPVPSSGRTTNERLTQLRADRCSDKCSDYTNRMAVQCEALADLKRDICTQTASSRSQRCMSDCARRFPNHMR